jgi:hypothetical protein
MVVSVLEVSTSVTLPSDSAIRVETQVKQNALPASEAYEQRRRYVGGYAEAAGRGRPGASTMAGASSMPAPRAAASSDASRLASFSC